MMGLRGFLGKALAGAAPAAPVAVMAVFPAMGLPMLSCIGRCCCLLVAALLSGSAGSRSWLERLAMGGLEGAAVVERLLSAVPGLLCVV